MDMETDNANKNGNNTDDVVSLTEFETAVEKRVSKFDQEDAVVVKHMITGIVKGLKDGKTSITVKFEEKDDRFDGFTDDIRSRRLIRMEEKIKSASSFAQLTKDYKISVDIQSTKMTQHVNHKSLKSHAVFMVHEVAESVVQTSDNEEDDDQPQKKLKVKPNITVVFQLSKKKKHQSKEDVAKNIEVIARLLKRNLNDEE